MTTEFVLLTCAGAWAVATAADGLAFRARQPLLALVPALGLFVFPAVIRPSSPPGTRPSSCSAPPGLLLFEAGPGWPPGAAGCRAPAAGPAPAGGCR